MTTQILPVDEMTEDIQNFFKQFEEKYNVEIVCPHVQISTDLLTAIRSMACANPANKYKTELNKYGYFSADFGNFNLTLYAKVD